MAYQDKTKFQNIHDGEKMIAVDTIDYLKDEGIELSYACSRYYKEDGSFAAIYRELLSLIGFLAPDYMGLREDDATIDEVFKDALAAHSNYDSRLRRLDPPKHGNAMANCVNEYFIVSLHNDLSVWDRIPKHENAVPEYTDLIPVVKSKAVCVREAIVHDDWIDEDKSKVNYVGAFCAGTYSTHQ